MAGNDTSWNKQEQIEENETIKYAAESRLSSHIAIHSETGDKGLQGTWL
jgi:hypothetical protein